VPGESPGLSDLLGMGLATAALLVVGAGLGWLVDASVGTTPVFLLVGILVGIAGAVGYTVRQFRRYLKK
jgi:F0F1-type ATP synthase assembly protein I